MKLPIPSAREVRWSFYVGALCAVVLTATVVWGIIHKISQSDSVLHVAVANADQVQRLSEQLDAQAATSADERAGLKRQLRAVREDLRAQRAAQRALLAYLRAHGIAVPPSAFSPSRGSGSNPKGPTPSGASTPSPSPVSPTAKPTPTPSPAPGALDLVCVLVPLLCR